ncbi:hypothetical protein [Mucilaginibacter sp. L3T2-6]|uniref:hypothetical protein n=1 Tax=Mucilaginibacter sp. L3T2-6 TaxID=3062491 RepID=UPI00267445CE|nr:hypothetical protein [Mucilaginibacter sp. L3T2-6]MDO3642525.1 hypothetical protein [Mucilaginibacter sp. L3T2-6]MDV6215079.1 hypothetical protein [Mucilaginibacter sp. L3T2-6]
MKKIILTLSLLIGISAVTFAQCDKTIVLNSSHTNHIDESGAITRTDDETAEIAIDKSAVNIAVNGEHKITANITSNTCNWSLPFKEGKSVIKAVADHDGQDKKMTITIEGKDGKVTLLFELEDEPGDRIKVAIDKFVEKA